MFRFPFRQGGDAPLALVTVEHVLRASLSLTQTPVGRMRRLLFLLSTPAMAQRFLLLASSSCDDLFYLSAFRVLFEHLVCFYFVQKMNTIHLWFLLLSDVALSLLNFSVNSLNAVILPVRLSNVHHLLVYFFYRDLNPERSIRKSFRTTSLAAFNPLSYPDVQTCIRM